MKDISVPPMIPIETLSKMQQPNNMIGSIRKSIRLIGSAKKNENLPLRLKGVEGYYRGAVFTLDGPIVIGRTVGKCNIIYPEGTAGISRLHCEIIPNQDGSLNIRDLGSSNGTFFTDGIRMDSREVYRINRGECFYLGSRNETYRII